MKQQSVIETIKYVRSILEENVNSVPLEGVTDVGTISINTVIKSVLPKAVESIVKVAPMELFDNPKVAPDKFFSWEIDTEAAGFPDVVYTFVEEPEGGDIYNAAGSKVGTIVSSATTSITIKLNGGTTSQLYTRQGGGDFDTWHIFDRYNGGYINKPADYLRMLVVECSEWERPVLDLTPLSSPYVSIARSPINMSVGNNEKPLAVDSFQGGHGVIELYPLKNDSAVSLTYIERPAITGTTLNDETINCDDGIYNAVCFYAAYLVAMIKGYANANQYQQSALDSINVPVQNLNATAGAPVQQ